MYIILTRDSRVKALLQYIPFANKCVSICFHILRLCKQTYCILISMLKLIMPKIQ